MSCGGKGYWTGSEAAAEQRGSSQVVVDSVCSGREVRSSANVDVDDDGRCGRRYGDEVPGMSCGSESCQTGSEAAAMVLIWYGMVWSGSVWYGLVSMRPSIRRRRFGAVLWRLELPDWFRGGGAGAKGGVSEPLSIASAAAKKSG